MISSFVIGFHTKRIHNLLQTLRFLAKDHKEVIEHSQLVAICQNNMDDLKDSKNLEEKQQFEEFESIRENFERSSLINANIKNMHLPYVTNIGVKNCENEKIIILESDRLLPKGYFKSVIEELKEGVCITCKNMKKLLAPATDQEIEKGSFNHKEEWRSESNEIGMRNMWSGNTAIHKNDYNKANKMDEYYVGYGWADSDMTCRMRGIGIQEIYRPEIELHLWQPSETYGDKSTKEQFVKNGIHFCKKWGLNYPDWFKQEISSIKQIF